MQHIHLLTGVYDSYTPRCVYIHLLVGVYESYTRLKSQKQMTALLNVLCFKHLHVYLHQNMDFSTYEGLPTVY